MYISKIHHNACGSESGADTLNEQCTAHFVCVLKLEADLAADEIMPKMYSDI